MRNIGRWQKIPSSDCWIHGETGESVFISWNHHVGEVAVEIGEFQCKTIAHPKNQREALKLAKAWMLRHPAGWKEKPHNS